MTYTKKAVPSPEQNGQSAWHSCALLDLLSKADSISGSCARCYRCNSDLSRNNLDSCKGCFRPRPVHHQKTIAGTIGATLETLANLRQPREQTVRHVQENESGQAVIRDQIHHHTVGNEDGKSINQSHAAGLLGQCSPTLCPDSTGRSMSNPGSERP